MSEPLPYVRELDFSYGAVAQVSPLIRRVIAHNPSVFTFHGTGTYIVGHGKVAIIDAGPDLAQHVDAVLAAVRGETVTHLIVTTPISITRRRPATSRPQPGLRPTASARTGAVRGRRWRKARTATSCRTTGLQTARSSPATVGRSRPCILPATPRTISASRWRRSGRSSPATT